MTSPAPSARADELGHQLAMRLRAAYARLRRNSNLAFSAFGMTADQYVLLTVLAREGEATQQQLVQRCDSDTATIGTMLALLEAKRLVTRAPHPEDGRARSVALTAPGRKRAEQMRRSSSRLRADLVDLFAARELPMFIGFLDRVAGALQPPGRKPASTLGPRRAQGRTPILRRRRP